MLNILVHENRPDHMVGVKLLVLSLARHAPDAAVTLVAPGIDGPMRSWLEARPTVRLAGFEPRGAEYNVKPSLLLQALDAGLDPVVWLDSDIIVAADPRPLLVRTDPAPLIASEETYWGLRQGGTYRTRAWGLPVGRRMPATINTGVLGVTGSHRSLLLDWAAMLEDPQYLAAQRQTGRVAIQRPIHLLGDQDALTALLGAAAHAAVPLTLLRRGRDIIQHFGPAGYTVLERLANLRRPTPPLIHSMGRKPYICHSPPRRIRDDPRTYYDRVYVELAPYLAIAREYRHDLGEDTGWMDTRTRPARVLSRAALGHHDLQGLPLAAMDGAVRAVKCALNALRSGPAPP